MDTERRSADSAALDAWERVLDKGILIEAVRVWPDVGLGQIAGVARVRVLRAEAYLDHVSPEGSAPRAA